MSTYGKCGISFTKKLPFLKNYLWAQELNENFIAGNFQFKNFSECHSLLVCNGVGAYQG